MQTGRPPRWISATVTLFLFAVVWAIGTSHGTTDATEARPLAPTGAFGEIFQEVGRITLRAGESEPMAAVTAVAGSSRGLLAVADRRSSRVFVFDTAGAFQRVLGGPGDGPGEFSLPTDVAFDASGRLYVADSGNPRITRFSADLRFDTTFRLDSAFYAMKIARTGRRMLALVNAPGTSSKRLRLYSSAGRLHRTFHVPHPAYLETPYWEAATRRLLAVSSQWIVTGGNLTYPLVRYDRRGRFVDSIGSPPRSWIQAPRPERGAFRGPNQLREFVRWKRTFTTIQGMAVVGGRYLVVAHERLDPDVLAYEDARYFTDVYDLRKGAKLWTDVDFPGPILMGGASLYLLEEGPPGGWVLTRYEVTP